MIRLARRASLLVVLSLLVSTATVYAECARVLWTEERSADGEPPKLWVTDVFTTREQCTTRLELTTALIGRSLGGRAVGNMVVMRSKEGKPSLMFAYYCLPDTVDHRGTTAK
jgi:hypothetical protein